MDDKPVHVVKKIALPARQGKLTANLPAGWLHFEQKSETTGPMGMKHIYYDYEKDPARAKVLTLYFDFSGK